ncbi:anti-sigma factor [Paenibacillus lentus]|uniref:Anti-sigma factor n=1 Tax=Paenibacillus lentus TaxID=1338368 RepID=A0A3Q8SB20_9BACL|nr:anti-sigma factor [Paenibacillus lentus]AZK46618.1 anti-sigma factor [Paenibacillus lentus]
MDKKSCKSNSPQAMTLMTEPCTLFAEEKLVDFAMGQLPDEEQATIQEHQRQCLACDAMIREWKELLNQGAVGSGEDNPENAVHPYMQREPQSSLSLPQPPRRLRRQLLLTFWLRSLGARWTAARSRYIFGSLGGLTVLILLCGLLYRPQIWSDEDQSRIERDISHQIHLIQSAETERYPIKPHPPYYGEGMVWLKRESGEMLIVVDGFHSLVEKDYQIWLQMDNESSSPGILPVKHPEGKSYYHGYGAAEAERLIISLEPKGGSRVQTGPEAVFVEMKH